MKKKKISSLLKEIFSFEFCCSLIFMIVTYVMLMKHELWFDEVQAWALAKNLNVIELISQMKIEGHSAMWSLFLKIFVQCGFNVVVLNFISWFIGVLSTILICYKTNFNKLIKVLIVFNVSLLYFSTVFARPYCIAFLMMVLLMIFYKDRYSKPYFIGLILLILSNTHLMVMGFLFAMFLMELYGLFKDKDYVKERIILMLFMVVGVLLFFFQIIGAFGARESMFNGVTLGEMFYQFSETILYFFGALFHWSLLSFLGVVFIILLTKELFKYKKYFLIFIISVLFYLLLASFYLLNSYKSFFIISVIIFCISEIHRKYEDKKIFIYFMLLMLCSLPNSIYAFKEEYTKVVSDSMNVWDRIDNRYDSNILTMSSIMGFSIYCDNCTFVNYYGGIEYKYNIFDTYGLVIFDKSKFYDLLIEYDIDYVVLYGGEAELLEEDLNDLEDNLNIIKKEYSTDMKIGVSKKLSLFEPYTLYKVNKEYLEYEK